MNKLKYLVVILVFITTTTLFAQEQNKTCTSNRYNIEVTTEKTTHISFPSSIVSVDLGSELIIAQKADGAENILRVKASEADFVGETNFSVICSDGSFYMFNALYRQEPSCLFYEMHALRANNGQQPTNLYEVATSELSGESPLMVDLISKSIHLGDKRDIKHIGVREQKIEGLVKGIYSHNNKLYFHVSIKNNSNVSYTIDHVAFKISNKHVLKKEAAQDDYIKPVRVYNNIKEIKGKETNRQVFVFDKLTLSPDKLLWIELYEAKGGRNLKIMLTPQDILLAEDINNLKM